MSHSPHSLLDRQSLLATLASVTKAQDMSLRRVAIWMLVASAVFLAPLLLLPYAHAARADAWLPVGLRGETVRALAVGSSDSRPIIYAETSSGLWRYMPTASPCRESTCWRRIDEPLPRTALGGPALAGWRVTPGRGRQIYALTGSGTARQLYRSDDAGDTWYTIGPAPGQSTHPPLLVLPGLNVAPDTVTLVTDTRVQRSVDGGASWAPGGPWPGIEAGSLASSATATRAGPIVATLLGESSAPDRLYAVTREGLLWISESGGLAWHSPAGGGLPYPITSLSIAPHFAMRVWAGTPAGLALSTDGGNTWSIQALPVGRKGPAVSANGRPVTALLSDLRVSDTVYIALANDMVYRSDDSGSTWSALGAPATGRIVALALEPEGRKQLYAATDDGVWVRAVVPLQPTPVPSPSQTVTPEPSPTASPTGTHTPTMTSSPLPTATATATPSPTATATPTSTPTPTKTPTRAATRTSSPTPTVAPPTSTATRPPASGPSGPGDTAPPAPHPTDAPNPTPGPR